MKNPDKKFILELKAHIAQLKMCVENQKKNLVLSAKREEDLRLKVEKLSMLWRGSVCPNCHGVGTVPQIYDEDDTCPTCKGTGKQTDPKERKKITKEERIWAEMARRKLQFHKEEDWKSIRLWGLFSWGHISKQFKNGELLTNMKKENRTVWVVPSEKAYNEKIKPLLEKYTLEELTILAGWDIK